MSSINLRRHRLLQLTQNKPTLFIDQWGTMVWASNLKELRDQVQPGRLSKQYQEKKDGRTVWNGYVIGDRWFTAFHPCEVKE